VGTPYAMTTFYDWRMLLWIAVNLQQYKCKYRKPQFNNLLDY